MSVLEHHLQNYEGNPRGSLCFHIDGEAVDSSLCGYSAKYSLQRVIDECKSMAGDYLDEKEMERVAARCKRHRNSKAPSIAKHLSNLIFVRKAQINNTRALAIVEERRAVQLADSNFVRTLDHKEGKIPIKQTLLLQATCLPPELCRIVDQYTPHIYFWAQRWDYPSLYGKGKVEVFFYILDHDGTYVPWKSYPCDDTVPSKESYVCNESSTQLMAGNSDVFYGYAFGYTIPGVPIVTTYYSAM